MNRGRKSSKIVPIAIVLIILIYVSSCWRELTGNKSKEIDNNNNQEVVSLKEENSEQIKTVKPRVNDEIIDCNDYIALYDNYSTNDENRWYKLNVRIYSIDLESNRITVRDGLPEKATAFLAFNFNNEVNLSQLREGDNIEIIGFSNAKMMNSISFDGCYLEIEEVASEVNVDNTIIAPRESDEIIDADYVELYNIYTNEDSRKWYRLTGRIHNISDSIISFKDGLPDGLTKEIIFYMNPDVDLSNYREGDTVTIVGMSNIKIMESIALDYCYIE